jgi:cytochrome P450
MSLAMTASSAHLPPMAAGLPVLGHTLTILGDGLPSFVRFYQQHGSVFRLRLGVDDWIMLAGAEAMREANRLGHEHLVAKPLYFGFAEAAGSSEFILANDGPEHAHVRRMLKPIFHRDYLLPRLPPIIAATREAVREWPLDRPFDIMWALKDLVTRQLSIALTGTDPKGLVADLERILSTLVMVEQMHLWPRLMLKLPAYKHAHARVRELCDRVVREHKVRPSAAGHEDMVDALLAATRTDGAPLRDGDLFIHTLGGFLAGLDTVAVSSAFALYALHKHPQYLPPILAEVDAAFAAASDGVPDVRRMPELHAALLEVLRLYPVLNGVARQVQKPFTYGGYTFESGQKVLLGIVVSHFLPEFYPDPYRFDPARMKAPRSEHKKPFAFGPFGVGPHTCLGANMGELQLMVTVATLLHERRFALSPHDYELKIRVKTVRKPEKAFRMRVRRR